MIRATDRPDVFEVRLFVPTDRGLQPRWLRVDTRIALDRGDAFTFAGLPFDASEKKHVLWVALIEKACAIAFRGGAAAGYEALDGNIEEWAFAVLTGCAVRSLRIDTLDDSTLAHTLARAQKNTCVMADSQMKSPKAAPGGSKSKNVEPLLSPCHVFTVIGLGRHNRVKLRDPNGFPVSVPMDTFRTYCDWVSVADL